MRDGWIVYVANTHQNLHAIYSIAKAFSAPLATIIAAAVATWITWTFGSRQHEITLRQVAIAKQEADTALEQLRRDLFDRRYKVYDRVVGLLTLLINRPVKEPLFPGEVMLFRQPIDEARFLFSDPVCEWLQALWEDVMHFLEARHEPGDPDFLPAIMALTKRLRDLQGIFELDMKFAFLNSTLDKDTCAATTDT